MKRIFVNPSNYTTYRYAPFFDGMNECRRPQETPYEVGEVVFIKDEKAIGVVLGIIDVKTEELRTDMSGMVSFDNIRPATLEDFKIEGVKYVDCLLPEAMGITVNVDNPFSS
jgi:hypothetical protein